MAKRLQKIPNLIDIYQLDLENLKNNLKNINDIDNIKVIDSFDNILDAIYSLYEKPYGDNINYRLSRTGINLYKNLPHRTIYTHCSATHLCWLCKNSNSHWFYKNENLILTNIEHCLLMFGCNNNMKEFYRNVKNQ